MKGDFMEQNVGKKDKMLRYAVAAIFLVLTFTSSWWFIIPAAIAFLTAFLGVCGIYSLFGINTCKFK